MRDFFSAMCMSVSFFTILPAPSRLEWTQARIRWLPVLLPFAGLTAGLAVWAAGLLLLWIPVGLPLKAALLVICWNAVTGGLHLDAWMDAADGFFSRRDREQRLRIMSDPATGAFAVMAAGLLFLLQYGMMQELLAAIPGLETGPAAIHGITAPALAALPYFLAPFLLSRTGAAWMIYHVPFAKKEGLAAMYGAATRMRDGPLLVIPLSLAVFLAGWLGIQYAAVIGTTGVAFLVLALYAVSVQKHFGGITGDLLGAFITLCETLTQLALLIGRSLWS